MNEIPVPLHDELRARRLQAARDHEYANAIEYIHVLDHELIEAGAPDSLPRQQILMVYCIKSIAQQMSPEQAQIHGGVRIQDIQIRWLFSAARLLDPTDSGVSAAIEQEQRDFFLSFLNDVEAPEQLLLLHTDGAGDFSPYLLQLWDPPNGGTGTYFEPSLSSLGFSFKIECPTQFDCKHGPIEDVEYLPGPRIDYLAKDYTSFRRLILDRLSTTLPEWREQTAADPTIAIVEILAYMGDQLSYYQDAVATEAYLNTARQRISVRRHARLLDYHMHEGCNARLWVHFEVSPAQLSVAAGAQLLTKLVGFNTHISPGTSTYERALSQSPQVFETMHDVVLRAQHNEMELYTWGGSREELAIGTTHATLGGHYPHLQVGDVIILQEKRSFATGRAASADPDHRQAVRLVRVELSEDELGGRFLEPPTDTALPVTELYWHAEDALDFSVCLSRVLVPDNEDGAGTLLPVSVALGNVVLADEGRSFNREHLSYTPADTQGPYRPYLPYSNISFREPYDHERSVEEHSARAVLGQDPRSALPDVELCDAEAAEDRSRCWKPKRDLLHSDRFAREFVAEVDNEGETRLRFGDGVHGRMPSDALLVSYRVGNGVQGNIGAQTLGHYVGVDPGIETVCNPLPASGGRARERMEAVKQYAPRAFRQQERAVTAQDYADKASLHPQVQKAVATLRWTGSWHTVFVTVDRLGGLALDSNFEAEMRGFLEPYRMAAHDLEIEAPRYVSLDLAMTVCVKKGYFREKVHQALLRVFSSASLDQGRLGFFHPDRFTFAQTVYLSQITEVAMNVAGVKWIDLDDAPPKSNRFRRWGETNSKALKEGRIEMGRLEIARVENDPNAPENGLIQFYMVGGL